MFGRGEDLLGPSMGPGVLGFVQDKCLALLQGLGISQLQEDTAVRASPKLSGYVGGEFGQVTSCNQSHFQHFILKLTWNSLHSLHSSV